MECRDSISLRLRNRLARNDRQFSLRDKAPPTYAQAKIDLSAP